MTALDGWAFFQPRRRDRSGGFAQAPMLPFRRLRVPQPEQFA